MKKGGGFCEMMRGCSVREMAARGAWRGEVEGDGDGHRRREKTGRGRPEREMDAREMGSVRWVLKGRDGAWRRWVVRDEEEMMMGCCVREMELGSLGSASRSGRKMELGGDGL